jgi:hypothetical protein
MVMAWLAVMLSVSGMAQKQTVPVKEDETKDAKNSEDLSVEQGELKLEIQARLSQFSDDFSQLQTVGSISLAPDAKLGISKDYVSMLEQRMNIYKQRYNSLEVMWTTYTQAQQMDIANDEELMTLVATINNQKQVVKDTLDSKTVQVKAIADFTAADQYIISQVPVYKKLYKRAFQLSLLKNLAPQLEKAKAREQLVFQKLQASHDAALAATEQVPSLKPRMNVLDEQFVVMKSVSEKVQALEYKPLIQRVKDYLIGLAAVAIILLFFNMIVSKYKSYKDKAANLKKMNEMMRIQGKDTKYPTI